MSKHIKLFETTSQYEEYINGSDVILPNVSVAEDAPTIVYYNPDPYGGHDYVEIGGIKWATMNVGAGKITDNGLYFQWGDTQGYTAEQVGIETGQKAFRWSDYKYGKYNYSDPNKGMTKYTNTDEKTILDSEDDAVTTAWGGNWRMPTREEFQALVNATTNQWTKIDGVRGRLFTSKSDSSKTLFFPTAGNCDNGEVWGVGSYGYYWSRSLKTDDVSSAWGLDFTSSFVDSNSIGSRCQGFSIRGVFGE